MNLKEWERHYKFTLLATCKITGLRRSVYFLSLNRGIMTTLVSVMLLPRLKTQKSDVYLSNEGQLQRYVNDLCQIVNPAVNQCNCSRIPFTPLIEIEIKQTQIETSHFTATQTGVVFFRRVLFRLGQVEHAHVCFRFIVRPSIEFWNRRKKKFRDSSFLFHNVMSCL